MGAARDVFSVPCPHCGSRSVLLFCNPVTPSTTELGLACNSTRCFHTWEAFVTATRTRNPSCNPNPAVHLAVVAQ